MKKTISAIILALSLYSFCFAGEPLEKTEVTMLRTPTNHRDKHYPRVPAQAADIECFYLDGYIHITFDEPEGNATLCIYNIADEVYGECTFPTSMPFIYNIGEITESMKIEVTTESATYIGYLYY